MSTVWTGYNDEIIAQRCERWCIVLEGQYRDFWVRPDGTHEVDPPHYSTDLVAVVRAAEAWRKQDEERRTWLLRAQCIAGEDEFVARMDNDVTTAGDHRHAASTPAAALAWALWKAVQG